MRTTDIAWLAGLLEGEGSFGFYGKPGAAPRIWIGMSDEDVIDRLRRLLNLGQKIHRKKPNVHSTKPCFVVSVSGRKAAGVMMMIYTLMGVRRRAKIREVLSAWRHRRALSKHPGSNKKPFFATGV